MNSKKLSPKRQSRIKVSPSSLIGTFIALPLFLVGCCLALRFFTESKSIPFPHPVELIEAFPALTTLKYEGQTTAFSTLYVSIKRVLLATSISLVCAVLFAFLLSWRRWLWSLSQPTIDLFRSIPVTFFVPILAVATGSTAPYLPWALAAVPCTLIMLLQIHQGISNIDKDRIHIFCVLAGSKSPWLCLRHVVLPEIMPEVVAGLRLGCSYAIVVVSVLEFINIGSQEPGFGLLIAQVMLNSPNDPRIFAGILVFGFFGLALNKGLEILGNWLTKWRTEHVQL
jgi:ABC-type nitrate/sulfonate/bicarbonate transport system permease component